MISVQTFTFNPYQENTYLVFDETKKCVVIDPGMIDEAERNEISDFIKKNDLTVEKLLNTHCHIDHVLGNKYIAETYKVNLEAHKLETIVLNAVVNYAPSMGIKYEESPAITTFLDENDVVKFGNSELEILFCPGHSPGSICFYSKNDKLLIGGDVLFQMSIGRADLPGGDYDTLINSIKNNLWKLPNDVIVYPGHGASTNIIFEKNNNPFFK